MTDAVERVALTHLQIPLKEPFRIAAGEVTVKDAILVTVETKSGIANGESSPLDVGFGDSCDSPEGCWNDLTERIAPTLLGRSFTTVEDIAELASTWTGSRFAIAGAETALWDLVGQARHATIAEMLGASVEQIDRGVDSGLAVGLYPSIVELLKTIETHLAEGYRRVKIKIAPGRDVELVRAIRQHFGDLELMVDANGIYTRNDFDVFRALDDDDLLMFEQPLPADDIDGLAALQAAVTTPVCLDESAVTPARTAEAIRRGACRIVNIKIQRVGGFGPALALHDLCYEHGVACWVGSMPELGIGQAQGIHLAALANCKYPTDIEPSARWFVDDYVVPLIELSSPGLLSVPTRPGLGYQVDQAKVRRYQVRQREFIAQPIERNQRMIPIVDTHQHLWDLKIFRLPWQKDNPKLARCFVMRDYLEAVAGLNVVKSIYMEVDVEPSQQPAEADHAIAICRRGDTPMSAAVISGRPASDGFKEYLTRYKESPYLKGVRQVLHGPETPPGFCLDGRFVGGIRLLGEIGLSFDICIRPSELGDAAKLIDACPDTRFILDHCGNASVRAADLSGWRADIDRLARRPNVVCKVSGIVASAAPDPWTAEDLAPIINHVLDTFGPDRVMFGGDWPVCTLAATYRQWVEALQTIVRDRSERDQRNLFHDNAVAFYRLG